MKLIVIEEKDIEHPCQFEDNVLEQMRDQEEELRKQLQGKKNNFIL